MNTQMTGLLEQMRTQLMSEVEGEEAHGPDSVSGADAGKGEPGELGASNEVSALDALNLYLEDIVIDLLDEYEMTEEEAEDFMFEVLSEMVSVGEIPDLPEDEDDVAALAKWLGTAKSAGFEARVLEAAEEAAEE